MYKRFFATVLFLTVVVAGFVILPTVIQVQAAPPVSMPKLNWWWFTGLLVIPLAYALWPRDKDVPYYDYNKVRVVGRKGGKTKRSKTKTASKKSMKKTKKKTKKK